MRRWICAVAWCVMLLLTLPGLAQAKERRMAWSPQEFAALLDGFLKFLAAEEYPTDVGTVGAGRLVVCSTSCSGGVTISCSGTSCSKESGRCVKCGSSAQFCPGTTGTNCGTTTSVDAGGGVTVNNILGAEP